MKWEIPLQAQHELFLPQEWVLYILLHYYNDVMHFKTRYNDGMTERLKSENVVISAPLSFSGSAARIWRMTRIDSQLIKWLVLVPIALVFILFAWCFVMIWYVIIFGLFGIFVIPFRLLTRSRRNRKRTRLQHREVLEAIEKQRQL